MLTSGFSVIYSKFYLKTPKIAENDRKKNLESCHLLPLLYASCHIVFTLNSESQASASNVEPDQLPQMR